MRNKLLLLLIMSLLVVTCNIQQIPSSTSGQKKTYVSMERKEYIKKYNSLAVKEMYRSGIPASITLAQAMLESDNGNSTLARKSNNHFGIKCHSIWEGPEVYHDDDKRNECFRQYKSIYNSYVDHTDFILSNNRYQFLFELSSSDYKAWAKGLQKAGYATSRTYAALLIKIIEENQLYVYDQGGSLSFTSGASANSQQVVVGDVDNFKIHINKHRVRERNRVDYIIAKKGDTFDSITEEFGMLSFELFKYNELEQSAKLVEGQLLYLQPKRSKAEFGKDYHFVKEGETMYLIAQMYGIKTRSLLEKNLMKKGDEPKVGQKLWLRKIKEHSDVVDETPIIEGFDGKK